MKKRMVTACALWAGALLCALIPHAFWAEYVSRPLMRALGSLCARAVFPIAELLFIAVLVLAGLWIARTLYACVRTHSASPLARSALSAAAGAGALVLAYLLIWAPIARSSVFPEAAAVHTREQLHALCAQLTKQANALRDALPDKLSYDLERIPAQAQLATRSDIRVKIARYPEWMRAAGIAGICFPLTGEAIVNPTEPMLSLPFAACHEAAHQLGYGREDEANYVAYQACLNGDRFFRYSGTMYALYYAMDALRAEDGGLWLEQTRAMNAAVHDDFYSMNGFANAELSQRDLRLNRISDAFLRMNGQDGLKSYGRMVDLLLQGDGLFSDGEMIMYP